MCTFPWSSSISTFIFRAKILCLCKIQETKRPSSLQDSGFIYNYFYAELEKDIDRFFYYLQLLLENGANVNIRNHQNSTPIFLSLIQITKNLSNLYQKRKLKMSSGESKTEKLEHEKQLNDIVNQALEELELYIDYDADLNAICEDKMTPMHLAAACTSYGASKLIKVNNKLTCFLLFYYLYKISTALLKFSYLHYIFNLSSEV